MYLYRSWDENLYITDSLDSDNELLIEVTGGTTISDLLYLVSLDEALSVLRTYLANIASAETKMHKYTVVSSMGEYLIVEQATGKAYGHSVTAEDDGREVVTALYRMCEAMNGENDISDEDVEWMNKTITNEE